MTTPFPLGRLQEHDPQSWNYEHPKLAVPHYNVAHTLNAPPLDQGRLGSCEGNTAAEFLNCAKALGNRKAYNRSHPDKSFYQHRYLDEDDAVYLYSEATHLDQFFRSYPPSDTGTSGLGVAKAMKAAGALQRYDWTFTWEDFLSALAKQPVMLGTNWYESMFDLTPNGFVVPPSSDASPVGGHAYLAYVLDWTHSRVGCTNHWANWGIGINRHAGSFWITFDVLEQLLIHEGGESLVPVLM